MGYENLAYKPEVRYEMLDGALVSMSPRAATNHSVIVGNIYYIFKNFLKKRKCTPFSEIDVYLTEKDMVVPDVIVVCDRDIIKKEGVRGAPDLVVEVLSPSTARKDRGYKKNLYERCGVKEYWIVEAETSSIEVYLLKDGKYALDNVYTILPDFMADKMTEEEKNEFVHEFKTSLYPDLTISIEEVFEGRFAYV